MRSVVRVAIGGCLGAVAAIGTGRAEEPSAVPSLRETIEVTATRLPEAPVEVPASIQVIPGEELERRHITTLDQALALAMGASIAPGGDGGPASSVPEMMGLREFDAFLLVVDDVPWGGAFNPALASLDLTNVDRIEILRGSAPVLYGATSFVGVIHVIHRLPGETPREAHLAGGSYGSLGLGGVAGLPPAGGWRESVTAAYDDVGFKDDRTQIGRGHALYRGAGESGDHRFRLDFDVTILSQDPASPHPRVGQSLTTLVPLDANHNPQDARQDEDRLHAVFGHSVRALGGEWTTTIAGTRVSRRNVKGFLREDFDVPPDESNADGFLQDQHETDVYFDSHLSRPTGPHVSIVFGVDDLYGAGSMDNENFEYHAALDGSGAPRAVDIPVDERPHLEDTRSFGGIYGQAIWTPAPRWRVEAGARLNLTHERREGEVLPGDDGSGAEPPTTDTRNDTRGAGSLGVSFRAWGEGGDVGWLFADARDTFKPAAIDFGPEAEGEILQPEDARLYEAGLKGIAGAGRIDWEVSAYHMVFSNVVVATQVNGLPALENVGEERLAGLETQVGWRILADLRVQASTAYHDTTFGDYLADFGGTLTQLRGNRVEMSPHHLAALGVIYLPADGFNASATANYVGSRFLDKRNTALADDYATWSAGVGYRFAHVELRVDGVNLGDTRPPVSESELGDAQYYLLPARSIVGSVVWRQ